MGNASTIDGQQCSLSTRYPEFAGSAFISRRQLPVSQVDSSPQVDTWEIFPQYFTAKQNLAPITASALTGKETTFEKALCEAGHNQGVGWV